MPNHVHDQLVAVRFVHLNHLDSANKSVTGYAWAGVGTKKGGYHLLAKVRSVKLLECVETQRVAVKCAFQHALWRQVVGGHSEHTSS